ncbi:hypothetical protein BCU02_01495 [Vibrio lentus]|uniref:Transposase IS66 C-terminal domain-containing protein n=1 Tax=Vibrio lentus TaxID=136468 RepID=A0AB36XJA4_9VIBR|nr:hypothetical protein BCU51_24365 [Vibrio lentus]PMK32497.1 hypothetical protein BCU02_01495 [Vibrio lentus]PMK45038.1 hypothetical protein BCT99_23850 [Vibrio lentus]PML28879.1 hypothetical protein BCT79_25545 [Vibrio lentus]
MKGDLCKTNGLLPEWTEDHNLGVNCYLGTSERFPMLWFATFSRFLETYQYQLEWRHPLVIGRKNWLLSATQNGADASAMLYSIVETAKANGLILYDYMVKCMKELAKAEPDIDALLPWNFKH